MVRLFLRFLSDPPKFYRYSILPKIYKRNSFLKDHASTSSLQNNFIYKLGRYKINWDEGKKNVVLAQGVNDYEMCIKIAAASNHLALEQNANIGFYTAIYTPAHKDSLLKLLSGKNVKTNLDKLYYSFAGKLLYRNNYLLQDQAKINALTKKLMSELNTKQAVLHLEIDGVKVGDLLYDTYLRYANRPELDLKDPFFETLLIQTLNIFFVSKQKLQEYSIIALVSSYTTYIYHGIIVRLCLHNNIPVYTVGAYYSLIHRVLKEYPSHANNHFLFKKLFSELEKKEEIIDVYKTIFEKRFAGEIDSATTYMKQSAFSSDTNNELLNIDWKNTVVVLAHCFFDSPHIYRDLIFPDFYDWLNFTLDELIKQTELTIIVKQHPNGLPENNEIFAALKEKYKNTKVLFIDKKTSQLQIINSRPKAIITAYGTAAAEFSYKGFPVLTIYDNPFTAYDFTYLAESVSNYKNLLANIKQLEPKQNQREIIEYYYMQYFFFLQGRPVDYLLCAKYKGQTFSDEFLRDYLPNMSPAFLDMVDAAVKDGLNLSKWEIKNAS